MRLEMKDLGELFYDIAYELFRRAHESAAKYFLYSHAAARVAGDRFRMRAVEEFFPRDYDVAENSAGYILTARSALAEFNKGMEGIDGARSFRKRRNDLVQLLVNAACAGKLQPA